MRNSINTRSSFIRTTFTGALLGGMVMFGGCGEPAGELPDDTETAGVQQALSPSGPGAEVWRADMGVTIQATKDSIAKRITYVFEVTNHGDDDARSIVMAAHFPPGVTVDSGSQIGFNSCTPVVTTGSTNIYLTCSLSTLGVRGTASLTVTVRNPTNAGSQASAQVFNISPDPIVGNNYAQRSVL